MSSSLFFCRCLRNPSGERRLRCGSTPTHQVEDQDYQCYDQQQMDQASTHVKAETQKPQNPQNYKYCPKHIPAFKHSS